MMYMTGDKDVIKLYELLSPFENQWIASDLKKTKVYAHAESLLDLDVALSKLKNIPTNDILFSFVSPSYEPSYFQKNPDQISVKKNILFK